ncbi:hypothetical protein [Actinoplanes awajinensis]|uniref:Uncharacterized protein n=1 Tax=Actinoplanes awajinensis subsp. mycoplanecinus TaxID=135947 RepID=A0A0X3V5I8_9ACTN|nr:hypothetical protein [Actinoplanes awajinensis]KUL40069.1 hypothetical protein ADL15_08495 [Actinoplanes awajinensis subsp. mycoplanecinus]
MISSPEFETFGPWIHRVRAAADLPRLYRDSGIEPAACRLVLKVPRNIDRRHATPDMHLYDQLVAVEPETLTVLTRHGDGYGTVRLPLDRIVAIEHSTRMLDGRLILHTAESGPVVITYNGASQELVEDLVLVLRETYLPFGPAPVVARSHPEAYLGVPDGALVTAYRRTVAREPGMRLYSAVYRRPVMPVLVRQRLWPATLHASIVLADDRELQVIHRRDWFSRGGDDHSLALTVLPRLRIIGYELEPHHRYRGVSTVTLHAAGATLLAFPMPDGPEVAAFLTALGVEPA